MKKLSNSEYFMQQALQQAKKAFAKNEVPVGAIVVDTQGKIIARGHNLVEARDRQSAHAEIIALEKAGKKRGNWRLEGCWLYVTLEPCGMCLHLSMLSRVKGIIFGASSPIFGYHLDKEGLSQLYKRNIEIRGGLYQEESAQLLKTFFKQKREG